MTSTAHRTLGVPVLRQVRLLGLAAATSLLVACGASPEEPEPGELTGVVTTESDTLSFGSGDTTNIYSRVVVVTEQQLVDAYERSSQPGEPPPREYQYSDAGPDFTAADLTELSVGDAPSSEPAVAPVIQGHLRIPWSGDPRYLCFGKPDAGDLVSTDGCVLVDEKPPVAVIFQVAVGGIGLAH